MTELTYTNPRLRAEIDGWPMGSNRRGTAIFSIEAKPGKGERGVRFTIYNGKTSAPKVLTFYRMSRIVDGDDGRTYIIQLANYGHISIMRGDMKYQAEDAIFPDNPRFPAIRALFNVPVRED